MTTPALTKSNAQALRRNEEKWTKPLMDAGWNAIPNIIIEKQEALGLNAIDMNILLHLSSYWWEAKRLPHPSVATIAKAIGVGKRAVQKHINALEKAGLIQRIERKLSHNGSDTNLYSFAGLIKEATPFAAEKLAKRAQRDAEEKERLARKKPKLTLVQGSAS